MTSHTGGWGVCVGGVYDRREQSQPGQGSRQMCKEGPGDCRKLLLKAEE